MRLASLGPDDPVKVMPADVRAYVEVFDPLRLVETLREIEWTMPDDSLPSLMIESARSCRSAGCGFLDLTENPTPWVAAMFLEEEEPELLAQLSVRLDAPPQFDRSEGRLKIYRTTLNAQPGLLGLGPRIAIAASDERLFRDALTRYRAAAEGSTDEKTSPNSLGSIPEFQFAEGRIRKHSGLSMYLSLTQIVEDFERRPTESYALLAELFDLETLDNSLLRIRITPNGLLADVSARRSATAGRPNRALRVWHTPRLDESILEYIPDNAVAAACWSYENAPAKWAALIDLIDRAWGAAAQTNPAVSFFGPKAAWESLLELLPEGLELDRDVLAHVRSVALISLPPEPKNDQPAPDRNPVFHLDRIAILLKSNRPDQLADGIRRVSKALGPAVDWLIHSLEMDARPSKDQEDSRIASGEERNNESDIAIENWGSIAAVSLSSDVLTEIREAHMLGQSLAQSREADVDGTLAELEMFGPSKFLYVLPEALANVVRGSALSSGRRRTGSSEASRLLKAASPILAFSVDTAESCRLGIRADIDVMRAWRILEESERSSHQDESSAAFKAASENDGETSSSAGPNRSP
jgi:hypothetical protein